MDEKKIMLPTVYQSAPSEEACQIKIAKQWRGYCVRQHFLPLSSYQASKEFLKRHPDLAILPRASSGTAPVYFPPNLPVIFKETNHPKNKIRWHIMRMVRELCKQRGFANLKVPIATPYQKWIIEEKLPIAEFKQKEQVGIYCENRERFTAAVRQMTKLLCLLLYPDILTSVHPYQDESDIPLARYDNLMLFIEEGVAKIGLVDLEDVKIRENKVSAQDLSEIAQTALFLFPYHTAEIFSVLREDFPHLDPDYKALENQSANIVKRYNKIYHDHAIFILKCKPKYLEKGSDDTDLMLKKVLHIIEKYAISVTSRGSMLEQLKSRTFTIPIDAVLSGEPEESSTEANLRKALEELMHQSTICYWNIYLNHAKQKMIRIHY